MNGRRKKEKLLSSCLTASQEPGRRTKSEKTDYNRRIVLKFFHRFSSMLIVLQKALTQNEKKRCPSQERRKAPACAASDEQKLLFTDRVPDCCHPVQKKEKKSGITLFILCRSCSSQHRTQAPRRSALQEEGTICCWSGCSQ